jgi:hypothetical protein
MLCSRLLAEPIGEFWNSGIANKEVPNSGIPNSGIKFLIP